MASIDRDDVQRMTVVQSGGQPDQAAAGQRRGVPEPRNRRFPGDVLRFAPLAGQIVGVGVALAVGPTELGPLVVTPGKGGENQDQEGE